MQKFIDAEQQLETCMTIFDPLDVDIDISDDNQITASLNYPKLAEDPKDIKIVFDLYIVSKVGVEIAPSVASPYGTVPANIKTFDFSYRLPIQSQGLKNNTSGNTVLKTCSKADLLEYYKLVLGYLRNHANKIAPNKADTEDLLNELQKPKLYALAYIVIDSKDSQTIRPDYAMKEYDLDQQSKTDYDDFMLECVQNNIDSSLKDKVYFFKKYKEIDQIDLIKEFKDQDISAQPIPRSENRFFVKIQN
ncbi:MULTISPECIES: hypothetical protein [unclassified Francisella]|uniref:hypothetical protein n=1 Tax=unclassified Francisella TaxID=2610885 RepID=UPI002E34EA42|nr:MULTISPECIES: hypothetical protein [unclassified Francisella]MED7818499.1 hypothetical protein [Francisella sp. 19S2-4]MED7829335.1 hypothetical protein [Francisella sp. 19S2-10]